MEFLIAFVISFIVLLAVAVSFVLGKPPTYRPSRQEISNLLIDVLEKKASVERWEMFLSLPINHDPELEEIREQCLVIAYGDDELAPSGEGIDEGIFDKRGMARIKEVSNKLDQLIRSEPVSKFF